MVEGGHGELFTQRFTTSPLAASDALCSATPEAVAAIAADDAIAGNAAGRLTTLGARGHVLSATLDARRVLELPVGLRDDPAIPVYGRAPDARPMAT